MVQSILKRSVLLMLCAGVAAFTTSCSKDPGSSGTGGGSGGDGTGATGGGTPGGGGVGGNDGIGLSDKGAIEIAHSNQAVNLAQPSPITFQKGQVAVGGTTTETLTIKNVGGGDLTISQISLEYEAPAAEAQPAVTLIEVTANGSAVPIEKNVAPKIVLTPLGNGGGEIEVTVEFYRNDDSVDRNAVLRIQSDSQQETDRNVAVQFTTQEGLPVANVTPLLVDFGQVKSGETPKKPVNVSNTGSSVLLITEILFQGHPDYSLKYKGDVYEPGDEIKFDTPVAINPNGIEPFVVEFSPLTDVPAEGKVVFYTNDLAHPSGILIEIKANTEGPCIQVNPKKVQFGGKLIGNKAVLPVDVLSCGTADLSVTNIFLAEESNPNFTLAFTAAPLDVKPNEAAPLTIPVNDQATFSVEYVPASESPLGEDNQPVFDIGIIVIESNAFDDTLEVEISGLGVTKECPTAVGVIQEGEQVIPQTNLHLFGDQSFAPAGNVGSWKWAVQQPAGSASTFIPSETFQNPTFEVNSAGEYQFQLDVWDEAGVKSCVPWVQTVLVVPDEAIHVELLWHTPNDPDETDQGPEAGSDVDLHFAHNKYAKSAPDIDGDGEPDVWFDQPFDCFWFNAHPNWGSFDPSIDDDPGLDRDDTDGAGPENLNLNIPENTDYRVGVHYWSDHEYGPSFATLRVYIYSNLVFEVNEVKLVNHDMWDAATISWPSGKVTAVQQDGAHKITPAYQNPYFFQP